LSIIFDAMDQQKCRMPHIQGNPSWAKSEDRISSQIGSFIVHGHGTYGVFWDETMPKDANFWASCLLEVIKDVKETSYKDKDLPEVLYLQSDNASDNKNQCILGLCELLRDLKVFRKIKYSWLPVGHTHEDVDASFGALSRKLRFNYSSKDGGENSSTHGDTLTLKALFRHWKEGWPSLKKVLYVKASLSPLLCLSACVFPSLLRKYRKVQYSCRDVWT